MIFYFSATGNSKYVADRLQERFSGEMVSVSDAMRKKQFVYEAGEGEKIIFVFPVYFWNMPSIVSDFIGKLTLRGDVSQICAVHNLRRLHRRRRHEAQESYEGPGRSGQSCLFPENA